MSVPTMGQKLVAWLCGIIIISHFSLQKRLIVRKPKTKQTLACSQTSGCNALFYLKCVEVKSFIQQSRSG